MKLIPIAVALILSTGYYGNEINPEAQESQLVVQEQDNWCWLAVAEILSHGQARQCEMASLIRTSLKGVDCCDPKNATVCDVSGNPVDALNAVDVPAKVLGVLGQAELNFILADGHQIGMIQSGVNYSHAYVIDSRYEDGVRYRVWNPGVGFGWEIKTYQEIVRGIDPNISNVHWGYSIVLIEM